MSTIPVGALVRDRELPELGPGRIVAELDGGASRIVFEHQDEIRDVQLSRVEVNRLPLVPGMKVTARIGDFGNKVEKTAEIVEAKIPDSPDELCEYLVDVDGEHETVSEAELFPREPASTQPLDQFDALFWRGPFRFFARWGMHRTVSRLYEDSEGLPALIGARIEPHAHQLRAVRRSMWSERDRAVLADSSDLDRLVEAGLIYQCRTSRDPEMRTLVLAPGARLREWQRQLEVRFGGRSFERLGANEAESSSFHELAELLQSDRLVVSSAVAGFSHDAQTLLLGEDWDLVIVDGAHRMQPDEEAYEFTRELSELAESTLVLSPLPAEPDAEALASTFALADPERYDPEDPEPLRERLDHYRPIWSTLRETLLRTDETPDEDELEEIGDTWSDLLPDDPAVQRVSNALEDGDETAIDTLADHVRRHYGFSDLVAHTSRRALDAAGAEWPERQLDILDYEATDAERELASHLEGLFEEDVDDPAQWLLRIHLARTIATTPDRFVDVLEARLSSIEGRSSKDRAKSLFDRLLADPAPAEEETIWRRVLETAPDLPGERDWSGRAMKLIEDWQRASGPAARRLETAATWIESHLEADDDHRVLVFSRSRHTIEEAYSFFERYFTEGRSAMYHFGLPEPVCNDSVGDFRDDESPCRILLADELGAEGRRLAEATAMVHLDLPWSPERLERRIERLDRPGAEEDETLPMALLQGPSALESALADWYDETLELFDAPPEREARDAVDLEREWLERAGRDGAEGLEELARDFRERREARDDEAVDSYWASFDPTPSQLDDVVEYADLLDFIDGLDDPLPVRHWARMIGIDDHRVRPGVYDFKWHWSSVRRELTGFDMPEGDDPNEWRDEETVCYLSGTFGRRKALEDESLEFFGPGHLLVDALVDDAMAPTDGRATIFARRLGSEHRGKVFAVFVAQCEPNRQHWDDAQMPEGLVRRTHRRFWPESASIMVEIDPDGRQEPRVVEDPELIRDLEKSYEGPEADQKIEYEIFVRTIDDAAQFQETLRDAAELGLDELKSQRDLLVEDAANRLESDFAPDIDYFEGLLERTDDDEERQRAERAIECRRQLVESVRDYSLDLDALALVVGGTPNVLIQ
jgi:hypothetical protein